MFLLKFLLDLNYSKDQITELMLKARLSGVIPEFYFSGESVGVSYLLLEYVDGKPKDQFTQSELEQFVEALHRLHAIEVSSEDISRWGQNKPQTYYMGKKHQSLEPKLPPHINDVVENAITNLKDLEVEVPTYSILHGDLQYPNVLFTNQGVRFIDLDDITVGDPAYDLMESYVHLNLDPDQKVTLLKSYQKKTADEGLVGRAITYERFKYLTWYLWGLEKQLMVLNQEPNHFLAQDFNHLVRIETEEPLRRCVRLGVVSKLQLDRSYFDLRKKRLG